MAEEIQVDFAFMEYLRTDVAMFSDLVTRLHTRPVPLQQAGACNAAFTQFISRWTERRGELAQAIRDLDESIGKVSQAMLETDQQGADALQST